MPFVFIIFFDFGFFFFFFSILLLYQIFAFLLPSALFTPSFIHSFIHECAFSSSRLASYEATNRNNK